MELPFAEMATSKEGAGICFFFREGEVRYSLDLTAKSFGPKELLLTRWQSSGKGLGVRAKP